MKQNTLKKITENQMRVLIMFAGAITSLVFYELYKLEFVEEK